MLNHSSTTSQNKQSENLLLVKLQKIFKSNDLQVCSPSKGFLPRIEYDFPKEELQHILNYDASLRSIKKDNFANRYLKGMQRQDYQMLSHQERIEIIYLYIVHKIGIKQISQNLNLNYSSLRTILAIFKKTGGRTNSLLSYMTK